MAKKKKWPTGKKAIVGIASIGGLAGLLYLLSKKAEAGGCTPDTFEVLEYCMDEVTPKRVKKCQPDGTWEEELYICPTYYSDIITHEGVEIPLFWTPETGKPGVSFEYRDSISKQVSGTPF